MVEIIFTKHVKVQMKERGISEDEITNTIKFSEKTRKIGNIYYAQKKTTSGTIEVVFEKENYIKVITSYWI